jgi:prephenate dehydrogenase
MVGYGRFGLALADLLAEAGHEVRAWDVEAVPGPRGVASLELLVSGSEIVIVAVPIGEMRGVMREVRRHACEDHVVVDVGSVKVLPSEWMGEVFGSAVGWVATHPLFGPTSLALGERPLRVVVCPDPAHGGAVARVRSMYEEAGCEVVEQEAAAHDRAMAETHALAYFVAKGILDAGVALDPENAPPSSRAILRTVEAVRSDAGHLFAALHVDNPYAGEVRERFLEALQTIDRTLRETPPGAAESAMALLAIPDLGERSTEIREVRDLIDDIDRDIVSLLARRLLLARRAGRAKAGMGLAVRDARREAELLARRREWAEANGLDPATVESLFEQVLRYSRRVQSEQGGNH